MINITYDKNEVAKEMELPIEFMDELLNELFKGIYSDLKKINIALKDQNDDDVKFLLHTIKGAAANLRLNILADFIRDIENNSVLDDNLLKQIKDIVDKYKEIL